MHTGTGQRGRGPKQTFNLKPVVLVSAFWLAADDSAGTCQITFPDGWNYTWTGLLPIQLYQLLFLPNPKHVSPPTPRGILLTDYPSAKATLDHITDRRAFSLLGPPATGHKGSPPVGYSVFWGTQNIWDATTWSFSQLSNGSSNVSSWWPGNSTPQANASMNSNNGTGQTIWHQWIFGLLNYNGPSRASTCNLTISSSMPTSAMDASAQLLFPNSAGAASTLWSSLALGSNTLHFTLPDSGGVPELCQIQPKIQISGNPGDGSYINVTIALT